jgi:hypothetical protein
MVSIKIYYFFTIPPSPLLRTHSQKAAELYWTFRNKFNQVRIFLSNREGSFIIIVIALPYFGIIGILTGVSKRLLTVGKVYLQH